MNVRMKLAPVFYTLSQIKFNPISQMNDYVAKFQEVMRHNGFPDFYEDTQTGIIIENSNTTEPNISQKKYHRWVFNNIERNQGYILSNDNLVFHTTNYLDFETFSKDLLRGTKLLHEIVSLSFIDRIGLRYLDLIEPTNNDLSYYIKKEFLGLYNTINGDFKHNFSEALIELTGGKLLVKSFITEDYAILPPDLNPLKLELNPRFKISSKKTRAILDFDFYIENRFELNLESLKEKLDIAHSSISDVFRFSITESAITEWE